jgi:DNA polymerase-3 subunit alpha
MEFTHLHWHSTFSFLEAIWTPKKIVAKAKELWFSAVAITDYFAMYWAIQLYEAAKENEIKPIIWTELWFVLDINWFNKVDEIWNICLLAKNTEWYQNLMKLVSVANQAWIAWKPKIDISTLWENNEWVIAFMWWEESRLWKMISRSETDDKIMEIVEMIQEKLWKENVYFELVAQKEDSALKKINSKVFSLAKDYWIPVITWNVFNYINKWDKNAREMALAIKDNKRMFDSDRRKPAWDFYLMTWDEIKEILVWNWYSKSDADSRIETNNKIANEIDIKINMWQWLFPKYQPAEDVAQLYDSIKDSLISD